MTEKKIDFVQQAKGIVETAKQRGLVIRIIGSCAIRIHCPKFGYIQEKLERKLTDIDLMSLSIHREQIPKLLVDLGYSPNERFNWLRGRYRQMFYGKEHEVVDVFFDKLQMCHDIDFKGRLKLDYPTIPLEDLLLEKMQIVEINEKDIKDVITLFAEHPVSSTDSETIDQIHIAQILANNWGFYYTVTNNLNKTKHFCNNIYKDLDDKIKNCVSNRIDKLIGYIENQPKTASWNIRAKIGTKKKWYREIK